MRKVILLLIGAVLCVSFITPAQAQEVREEPPLLMVILLDDSSTNWNENSVAAAPGYGTPGRNMTDPNRLRDQAVLNIVNMLASDQDEQHEIAVLRFGSYDNLEWMDFTTSQWVAIASSPNVNSQFKPVGGPNIDPHSAAFQFKTLLDARRDPPAGPGNVKLALEEAYRALSGRWGQDVYGYKPVVVLLTDDAPLEFWDVYSSPWLSQSAAANWLVYVNAISGEDPGSIGSQLRSRSLYFGSCQSATGGGIPVVTLALGAATWVTATGSIRQPALDAAGNDEYYAVLARQTNALSVFTGEPLYYRVDPTFASEAQLREDLIRFSTEAVNELRCSPEFTSMSPTQAQGNTVFSLTLSNFHEKARFIVDVYDPDAIGGPEFHAPNGAVYRANSLDSTMQVVSQWIDMNTRRELWTMNRPDAGWDGAWEIVFPFDNIGNRRQKVSYQVTLDVSTLDVVQPSAAIQMTSSSTLPELKVGLRTTSGLAIDPLDPLIVGATGVLNDVRVDFDRTADGLVVSSSFDAKKLKVGANALQVTIQFDPAYVAAEAVQSQTFTIPEFIFMTDELSLGSVQPISGSTWECRDIETGDGVVFGQRITTFLNRPKDIEEEGLYSFVSVGVYLDDPSDTGIVPAPTPVVRLLWDREGDPGMFSGVVSCPALVEALSAQLASEGSLAVLPLDAATPTAMPTSVFDMPHSYYVYVVFQDGDSHGIPPKEQLLSIEATATPTVVPTAVATKVLLPPAPAAGRDGRQQLESLIEPGQPGWLAIGAALIGFGGLLVFRTGQVMYRYAMPLSFVFVQFEERGAPQRVLRGWRRFLPFVRAVSVPRRGNDELFKLVGTANQLYLKADRYEVFVDRQRVSNGQIWPLQQSKTHILVNGRVFIVLDQRAKTKR